MLPHWSKFDSGFLVSHLILYLWKWVWLGTESTGTSWLTRALCLQAVCSRLCQRLGSPTCALLAPWWCRLCLRRVPWMPWEASLQPVAQAPRLWPRQVEWSAVVLWAGGILGFETTYQLFLLLRQVEDVDGFCKAPEPDSPVFGCPWFPQTARVCYVSFLFCSQRSWLNTTGLLILMLCNRPYFVYF